MPSKPSVALFLVAGFALASASLAVVEPKSAPANPGSDPPSVTTPPLAPIVTEDFEGGVVPPTGWTTQVQNATYTWVAATSPHGGTYGAKVPWDYTQDEWLITPQFNISSGTLTFWSMGSVYWCRDNYNNCDVQVLLVVGTPGGGDDVLVGTAEASWTANWTWAQSSFNLNSLLPGGAIRIAFRYVGNDGADAHLDDVLLDGVAVPVELMRFTLE